MPYELAVHELRERAAVPQLLFYNSITIKKYYGACIIFEYAVTFLFPNLSDKVRANQPERRLRNGRR